MSTTFQTRGDGLKRAERLIYGPEAYAPFILAPAAQAYVIDASIPFPMRLLNLAGVLTGTVTANVQRTRSGVTVSVTGLSAVALTSTLSNTAPTSPSDGTDYFVQGDILQVTLSSPVGASNLSLDLRMLRV
jgi:Zn-dependent alcohol dehydrogenase